MIGVMYKYRWVLSGKVGDATVHPLFVRPADDFQFVHGEGGKFRLETFDPDEESMELFAGVYRPDGQEPKAAVVHLTNMDDPSQRWEIRNPTITGVWFAPGYSVDPRVELEVEVKYQEAVRVAGAWSAPEDEVVERLIAERVRFDLAGEVAGKERLDRVADGDVRADAQPGGGDPVAVGECGIGQENAGGVGQVGDQVGEGGVDFGGVVPAVPTDVRVAADDHQPVRGEE